MRGNRFLLDQMLDADVAIALLALGYDVVRVAEFGMSRADDDVILAKATATEKVLVTLDEHFGDWARTASFGLNALTADPTPPVGTPLRGVRDPKWPTTAGGLLQKGTFGL
jgi:hypothetical protein